MGHCPHRTALLPAVLIGTAIACIAPLHRAAAQASVVVQGVADAELWMTDSGSALLTRNNGRPGGVGRLHLWSAAELGPRLVVYAAGYVEGGKARHEEGTEWYTDMLGVRYMRSDALVFDVGKMAHPVGAFASRRYSVRNPLIGHPDGYPVAYPVGLQLSGTRRRFDYRAAVVTLPVYREDYVPEPTATPRPAVGAGFTPTTGVRVGVSATWGPYLNDELPTTLLVEAGQADGETDGTRLFTALSAALSDVPHDRAAGVILITDGRVHDVPSEAGSEPTVVRGLAYYVDAKYTLTPRLFVATRVERNEYAYIEPESDTEWLASPTNMYNGELGVGYRFGAATLLKASVRADSWHVPPYLRSMLPNGAAFALQVSRAFTVFDASLGGRE